MRNRILENQGPSGGILKRKRADPALGLGLALCRRVIVKSNSRDTALGKQQEQRRILDIQQQTQATYRLEGKAKLTAPTSSGAEGRGTLTKERD